VVWGKEVIYIRDDHVMTAHEFYDQEMKLIKRLQALEIRPLGGKVYATQLRMENLEKPGEWTEVLTEEASFGIQLDDSLFSLASLNTPR
jgi:hypothetical protein